MGTAVGGRMVVVMLLGVLTVVALAGAAGAATLAGPEELLAGEVNRERAAAGLAPLALDLQLVRVARSWSGMMSNEQRLFHNPGLGAQVQGAWTRVGENVGHASASGATVESLAATLHRAFMASADHRANVLGPFDAVGVGVSFSADGTLWATVDFSAGADSIAGGGRPGQLVEAVAVAQRVFPAGDSAGHVVLTRAEVFADALGGAALAGTRGPVLFTPGPTSIEADPVLHPATRQEIDRILPRGGTVYLLGGQGAVSAAVERELSLDGYEVRRLAGDSRVETAVAVAEELLARDGESGEVLLARDDQWADAVSGGAYAAARGAPLLLTAGDALHPAVAAFLDRLPGSRVVALGGAAAMSDEVVRAAGARRVAGADRTETSVAIARELWGRTAASSGDQFISAPGFSADGWAYALAYVVLSAADGAPQLLVGDDVSPAVEEYLGGLGYGHGVSGEMIAARTVPEPVVDRLEALVAG